MPEAVKSQLNAKPDGELRGCLVAFWQSQPLNRNYGQAVNISSKGVIAIDAKGESGIQLPVSAMDHPILLRLYLFPAERNQSIANDPDGHEQLCRSMSNTSYNCFENLKDCQAAFELQPDVTYRGKVLKTLPVSDNEDARCRVCEPEKCNDGIDNDCNGKTDDVDGRNKVKCTKN